MFHHLDAVVKRVKKEAVVHVEAPKTVITAVRYHGKWIGTQFGEKWVKPHSTVEVDPTLDLVPYLKGH